MFWNVWCRLARFVHWLALFIHRREAVEAPDQSAVLINFSNLIPAEGRISESVAYTSFEYVSQLVSKLVGEWSRLGSCKKDAISAMRASSSNYNGFSWCFSST